MAYRRGYGRRKRSDSSNNEGEIFGAIGGLLMLGLMYLGFTYYVNKARFWYEVKHYVLPGALVLCAIFAVLVFFFYSRNKRDLQHKEAIIADAKAKHIGTISTFINSFGKEGKKKYWEYRSYKFDYTRLKDFRDRLIQDGLMLSDENLKDLNMILKAVIDEKEKAYLNDGFRAKETRSFDSLNKTGDDFENLIVRLYDAKGYSSKRIGGRGDQGGDVIARKNGENLLIQAKFYSASVGNAAVQQAVGARQFHGCNKAAVVTNSYFTLEAVALAKVNDIELVDGERLKRDLLENLKENWS